VELFYETRGNPNASNKVVFIMGLAGSHRGWDLQSKYFATLPDYQILLIDNRGAGFSDSPTTPYAVETMASDVIFLANEVGFQKYHLVGVSMGGMIAQHVALTVPEKIVSLILIVTRVSGGFFNFLPTLKGLVQFYRMQRAVDNPEALIDAGADLLFPYEYLEKIGGNGKTNREAMHEMVIQRNKEVPVQNADGKKHQMDAIRAFGLNHTQTEQLKRATFPILSIVGDQDTLIRPSHSYAMPAQIGADLVVIEGAGHGLIQQCPELANFTIKSFCDSSAKGNRDPVPKTTKVHYTYNYSPMKEEVLHQQATAIEALERATL